MEIIQNLNIASLTKYIDQLQKESFDILSVNEKIEVLMQNIDQENKEVIILGDFNCDLLSSTISNHTRKFLDLIEVFQLDQACNYATNSNNSKL